MSSGASAREQEIDRQRQARRDRENELVSLARAISGNVAQDPFFNFENLRITDPDVGSKTDIGAQNELISLFQGRADEILRQRFQPGLSQTRLSLVD